MSQSFEPWNPIPSVSSYFSIESVLDNAEGLRIYLREYETSRLISVFFRNRLVYQCRDESDLEGEASRSDGLGRGCFYIVENSELLARVKEDSVRSYDKIVHFSIVTDADCIDVLSLDQPTVEYL